MVSPRCRGRVITTNSFLRILYIYVFRVIYITNKYTAIEICTGYDPRLPPRVRLFLMVTLFAGLVARKVSVVLLIPRAISANDSGMDLGFGAIGTYFCLHRD